jgi:hypothetical protein
VHSQHDARGTRPFRYSEEVGDLVDGSIESLLLGGKSLRKFVTITLATGLEVEKIVHANAAVTPNVIERDLAAIKQLVEVGSTHPKTLRGVVRSEGLVLVNDSELGSVTHATSEPKQDGAQLNAGSLSISVQSGELLSRNVRGFDGLHANRPKVS